MLKNKILLFLLILIAGKNSAQEVLTLEKAIEIGLNNNYEIRIEKNNAEIAANNNTLGNAGILPKVDLQASTGLANNATKQEFSSGLVVDKDDVQSNNVNAGVYLTWTLFDGFRMFASHRRLKELETLGMLSSKIAIENSVSQIIVTYYNVVRQKQLIRGLQENIKISEERLKIAETKLNIGSGSKLDVLQAKVDKNAQTANLYKQQTTFSELKIKLNELLARKPDVDFEVSEEIPVEVQLKFDELKKNADKYNTELNYFGSSFKISEHLLNETRSQLYPRLNLNASYLFSRSENQAGFALLNQNLGLNLGLTATWTIFNGMNTSNQIKNARLRVDNAAFEYSRAQHQLDHRMVVAYRKYQDDQKMLALEEENKDLVKEAVTIALERFRIGSSNSLELKEVQKSYDDALTRLSEARYNAKVSETELLRLSRQLIK